MTESTKYIFQTQNGDVEFSSQEELERYFKGERPDLEQIGENRYKATFNSPPKQG